MIYDFGGQICFFERGLEAAESASPSSMKDLIPEWISTRIYLP